MKIRIFKKFMKTDESYQKGVFKYVNMLAGLIDFIVLPSSWTPLWILIASLIAFHKRRRHRQVPYRVDG